MKKAYKVSLMTAVLIIGAATLSSQAHAGFWETGDTLLQRVIKKFNLNQEQVRSVVDEFRDEKQAERLRLIEQQLDKAVQAGKITSDQKNKILAKHKEMHDKKPYMHELSFEERQKVKTERRAELEKWAKDNGIDLQYVFGFGFGKGHWNRKAN